ncbi:MAG: PadR family transcriptional regulator [Candidatus Saccharibacteria bacterium]|nr:PadR family transcriptional regulator [Candidatus Saccharibacteria bacterium]
MTSQTIPAEEYAANLATQLRKGFLTYCILQLCSKSAMYTSDIITTLHKAELVVVEGTVYPLLSRLQKDGLLTHEWRESELGPPRKYYQSTPYGNEVLGLVADNITQLHKTLKKL